MSDPMERILADALTAAGIPFRRGLGAPVDAGLDFYLPNQDTHIEVKQFHTDRIAEQMSRAPNVIALQGRAAVLFFADMVRRSVAPPAPMQIERG